MNALGISHHVLPLCLHQTSWSVRLPLPSLNLTSLCPTIMSYRIRSCPRDRWSRVHQTSDYIHIFVHLHIRFQAVFWLPTRRPLCPWLFKPFQSGGICQQDTAGPGSMTMQHTPANWNWLQFLVGSRVSPSFFCDSYGEKTSQESGRLL